jgi:predicted amidohydrolase YtcJ
MMKKRADTIFYNGQIHTVNASNTISAAMAVRNGKILDIGDSADILHSFSADSMIDLGGKHVFPGFIDAHCHFYGLALSLQWVDLRGAESFDEVIARMQAKASTEPGGWLVGRGWDQNLWPGQKFPDKARLDELFPDRPVALLRIDGHSLLANRAALDAAGIGPGHTYKAQEVETVNGRLTGILSENAADRLRSAIPTPEGAELASLLYEAQKVCFQNGLTGVTDAGLDLKTILFIDSLQKNGSLRIHISAMLNPTLENYDQFVAKGPYITDRLHISAIKVYADGSLGSRTALMKRPYSDDPSKSGVLVTSFDSIRKVCIMAKMHGYQVNTHCIGDSAVKLVLDIYAGFLGGKNDLRWRIEHAQVVDPMDLHLFGHFSVIPCVQATHATSDMYWAGDRLGPERIKGAYAYKQLMEQNGWIPNGTDFPIEQVSPLLTFYAATARQDLKGFPEGGFQPENALTREEALRSITIWAAKANFDENLSGSLEPGKWADFVVLDRDIMTISLGDIPGTTILATWIRGSVINNY